MANKWFSFWVCVAAVLPAPSAAGQERYDSGQRIVQESARRLYEQSGLEAEFRFRSEAFDQSIVGSGKYTQAGVGPEKLFRLEVSTQLVERKATMQMICGKQYLWIRRDLGPDQQSLARVTLRRLRQAIADAGPPLAADPSPIWLGITGLPRLVSSLDAWFQFEPAQEGTIGDRRVVMLRGAINAELRDSLLGQASKKGQGREQIPDLVELTLGADDAIPLFPYRIEYLKRSTTEDAPPRSVLLIDFSSARIASNLDPRQFEYVAGDQEVEDRTRLFIERLGLSVRE